MSEAQQGPGGRWRVASRFAKVLTVLIAVATWDGLAIAQKTEEGEQVPQASASVVSGVAEVAISGEFTGGLLLGSPKSGPPLREVEIGNVRTNHLSLLACEVGVANLAVQADGLRGIELHDGCSDVEMVHCTVTGASEAGIACANVPAFIANSILWGNAAALAVEGPEEPTLSHCCVEGGLPEGCRDGGGNTTEDPLLADAASGDLRLREGSPCAGAGLPLSELSLRLRAMAGRDLEGRPRPEPAEARPDLGAWETGGQSP